VDERFIARQTAQNLLAMQIENKKKAQEEKEEIMK
jgi:hypothetical protein